MELSGLPELETVLFDVEAHVATITINRPEQLNSFTARMMAEFTALWRHISEDDDIHAVVLRAAPGRAFSTGVDVKLAATEEGKVAHDNMWTARDPGESLSPKANNCWKPVIAAVHGMAAGGAFYWLNESDIVICSEDASFFDPHVTYGMVAALEPIGATYTMPLRDVLRMVLLGNDERISAETAQRIGLVSEIVPLERLWARANELAVSIAAKPPAAVQGSIKTIWQSLDMPRSTALRAANNAWQLGNPVGMAQVDRAALMAKRDKKHDIR
jgi:enoyl-CoA hydratase/carnithine racemase